MHEAADACDFRRLREIIANTGQLYEFAGACATNRGRDPWVLRMLRATLAEIGRSVS